MKYGNLTLGQIEAVFNKLGGMEGVHRLLQGKLMVRDFDVPPFPVWKTIICGKGPRTLEDFRVIFNDIQLKVDESAEKIFELRWHDFHPLIERTEIDLVIISPGMVGIEHGAPIRKFYKQARMFGLEPCSTETILQLCIQQKNEWGAFRKSLVIAWESGNAIFYIRNDKDDICLYGTSETDGLVAYCDEKWIFILPRE